MRIKGMIYFFILINFINPLTHAGVTSGGGGSEHAVHFRERAERIFELLRMKEYSPDLIETLTTSLFNSEIVVVDQLDVPRLIEVEKLIAWGRPGNIQLLASYWGQPDFDWSASDHQILHEITRTVQFPKEFRELDKSYALSVGELRLNVENADVQLAELESERLESERKSLAWEEEKKLAELSKPEKYICHISRAGHFYEINFIDAINGNFVKNYDDLNDRREAELLLESLVSQGICYP